MTIARPGTRRSDGPSRGRVVLTNAVAVLGGFLSGFVARIVKSWPDRSWPAGQGTGQGPTRARRPGPECDPEISASPPVSGRARAAIISGQETRQDPDGTAAVGGLDLNVPGGKLAGLVVTRPGDPACPRRRRKGHEHH